MHTKDLSSTQSSATPKTQILNFFLAILGGSLFFAMTAQIALFLPFTPVPITLQSMGVALLSLTLGPKKAPLAIAVYLLQATIGLPVLAGGISNPFWIFSSKAGYLIGFFASSWIISRLLEKYREASYAMTWCIYALNEILIISLGTLWFASFMGLENALSLGAAPFLGIAFCKATILTLASKPTYRFKTYLQKRLFPS